MKRLLALGLVLALALPAYAQTEGGSAVIAAVDSSAFPEMSVYLSVNDASGSRIAGLPTPAFALTEDGSPIASLAVAEEEVGVQVVFVLDTGPAFKSRDANGATRLDRLKQALAVFARSRMADGVDDVTVLSPEGTLIAHSSAGNDIVQALETYTPTEFAGVADHFPFVNQALDFAADAAPRTGMRRYLVFLSNGLERNFALDDLATRATAAHITIHTVFVGPEGAEATAEAKTLGQLATLTGGTPFVFHQIDDLEPLYQNLVAERTQYKLAYRSALNVTGQHLLSAQIKIPNAGILLSSTWAFPLRVEAPTVFLNSPASLERAPTFAVPFSVNYPDGHTRNLREAILLIDGQATRSVIQTAGDTLVWPLANYAETSAHTVQVRITDELGLMAESNVLTVTVNVAPAVLLAPPPTTLGPPGLVLPLAVLLVSTGLIGGVAWWWLNRNRRAPTPAASPVLEDTQPFRPLPKERTGPLGSLPKGALNAIPRVSMPQLHFPKRPAGPKPNPAKGKAYLEVLEAGGGGAPRADIEILGAALTLGRDPSEAAITFPDTSVSRRHARITEASDCVYKIFDAGSTSGTWVNFEQVPAEGGQELKDGDVINLGRVQMRFKQRVVPPPKPAESAKPEAPLPENGSGSPPPKAEAPKPAEAVASLGESKPE